MKKIITESQLKQMIKEAVKRLLTEDKVSDYIKKQIVNNSRYSKEMLATPVAELPKDVRSNMQESAPSIYNACVNHGQNLSAFLRLYFLSYFDINHGKGPVEYVMGLARIAIGELKMFDRNAESDTALLKQVVLFLHNSTDEQLKAQYDGNLNGLDFYALVNQLNGARREFNSANRTRLKGATDGRVSAYKVVAINSAEEAAKYGRYTSWCVTHSEANYDGYTEGGRRFYFCLRDGFEDVPKRAGEGCPLDDYGLSMISVLVDPEGEPNVVTTRWNHENDGENNENLHTAEQVQVVTNIDFYATFKPYSLEQLTAMGITPFYAVQDMLDKGAEPEDVFKKIYKEQYGFRVVYLNEKFNFIDTEGQLLSQQWFEHAWDFKGGFAAVRLNGKWNFINTEGQIVSKQWFDNVGDFNKGFANVELNGKRNFINTEGRLLSQQWFDNGGNFNEGLAEVRLNDKWNFINTKGQLLSQQWFDNVGNFNEGFAAVKLNGKWNFINREGQVAFKQWFDWAGRFSKGFAQVKLNGKWNFINTEGQLLSQQWFDSAGVFIDGFAVVELNGKMNFINTEGQLLSKQWFEYVDIFTDGFAAVRLNDKWNFINTEGQIAFDQWFDNVWDFSEGVAEVILNGKRYNLDKEGNLTLRESRRIISPTITESQLRNIIKETVRRVLKEGKDANQLADTFVRKNPNIDKNGLIKLLMADPTASQNDRGSFAGKYGVWIGNMYANGSIKLGDIPELKAALITYDKNKSQLPQIKDCKSLSELIEWVKDLSDDFKAVRKQSKAKADLEKVYEDDEWVVYVPHSHAAARRGGEGTHWCTASENDYYYNYYSKDGPLYINIRKSDGAKFQFHFESNQFMDADDDPVSLKEIELSDGLINFYSKISPLFKLSLKYDFIDEFVNGFALVGLNGEWNLINHEGQLISKQWFDHVTYFIDGFAKVMIKGMWNFIKTDGQLLSKYWFDDIKNFQKGFARVRIYNLYNFIGENGLFLSKQWFDAAGDFNGDFAIVKLDGKDYTLDTKGNLTLRESRRPLSPIITESILKRIKSECIKRLMDIK